MTYGPQGSQVAPGWYPDPSDPAPPGSAPVLRWWDGVQWTAQVQMPPGPAMAGPSSPPRAPDGRQLATWGRRLSGFLIDGLILWALQTAVAFPLVKQISTVYLDYLNEVADTAGTGTPPSPSTLYGDIYGPLLGMTAVSFVLGLLYAVGFWRWKAATPGQLAVGLRVVSADSEAALGWRAIWLRWLLKYGVSLVGVIPFAGSAVGVYSLLDGLWPLWDDRHQTLHDKVARTQVVRTT